MTIDGGKMAKSLGNVYTINDIEQRGFDPLAFRYLCLITHYRSILNFTWDGLKAAQTAYNNLVKQLAKHAVASENSNGSINTELALFDDLNTPLAIGQIWDIVKQKPSRIIYAKILWLDKVLSLDIEKRVDKYLKQHKTKKIPPDIISLASMRQKAKDKKDFETADDLRNKIQQLGYEITDTKDGFTLDKIN